MNTCVCVGLCGCVCLRICVCVCVEEGGREREGEREREREREREKEREREREKEMTSIGRCDPIIRNFISYIFAIVFSGYLLGALSGHSNHIISYICDFGSSVGKPFLRRSLILHPCDFLNSQPGSSFR